MSRNARPARREAVAVSAGVALAVAATGYGGLGIHPDSGAYFLMAIAAKYEGPFQITQLHWPPGYPWLLALTSTVLFVGVMSAAVLINALSAGVISYVTLAQIDAITKVKSANWRRAQFVAAGLTLLKALDASTITTHALSEMPFIAATMVGLHAVFRWRSSTARNSENYYVPAAWFAAVLAWSFRHIGVLGFPILAVFLAIGRVGYGKKILGKSARWYLSGLPAVALFLTLLRYNRTKYGTFLPTTHHGEPAQLWTTLAEFVASFFGFFGFTGRPLPGVAAAMAAVAFLGLGLTTIVRTVRKSGKSDRRAGLAAWPYEWIGWGVLYFAAMVALSVIYGIYGTERFMSCLIPPGILAVVFAFHARRAPLTKRWAQGLTAVLILWSAGAWGYSQWLTRHPARWIIDYSGVERTPEFKRVTALRDQRDVLVWYSRESTDLYRAAVLAAHFPCDRLFIASQPNMLPPAPTRLLIASNYSLSELKTRLGDGVQIDGEYSGLEMSFVSVTSRIPPGEAKPYRASVGCTK